MIGGIEVVTDPKAVIVTKTATGRRVARVTGIGMKTPRAATEKAVAGRVTRKAKIAPGVTVLSVMNARMIARVERLTGTLTSRAALAAAMIGTTTHAVGAGMTGARAARAMLTTMTNGTKG